MTSPVRSKAHDKPSSAAAMKSARSADDVPAARYEQVKQHIRQNDVITAVAVTPGSFRS